MRHRRVGWTRDLLVIRTSELNISMGSAVWLLRFDQPHAWYTYHGLVNFRLDLVVGCLGRGIDVLIGLGMLLLTELGIEGFDEFGVVRVHFNNEVC